MKMPHKLTRDQKKLRTALIMLTPAIIFLADYQLYTDKSEYYRYTYQLSGRFQICSGYGYFCKYMEKFSILYDFFSFSHAVYTRRSGRGSRYRRSRDFQKVFQRYPSPAPFSISGDRFYTCDLDGCKL